MITLPILAAASDADAGAALAGGVALFSLFFMIVGLVLAITWIIFPFIVISKCNKIAHVARQILYELQYARVHSTPPPTPQVPPGVTRTPIAPTSPAASVQNPLPPLPKTGPGLHEQ